MKNEPITTMILPKLLLAAASTDKTRAVLSGAYVDAELRCIAVTNGRICVVHPIPGEEPVKGCYITPENWKIAKARNSREMKFDFTAGTLNGEPLAASDHFGNYPNYRQVIPTHDTTYRFIINPALLADVAAALGQVKEGITFELDDTGASPIRLTMGDKTAVLMPMTPPKDSGIPTGCLVAKGESSETMMKEIANLRAQIAVLSEQKKSERSDTPAAPGTGDDGTEQALRDALHESRARVTQLEAYIESLGKDAATPITPAALPAPARKGEGKKPKAEVPPATAPPTLSRNEERNGIELRFDGKPDEQIRLAMKGHGFRWLPSQPGQPWAVKYSEEAWIFAMGLANGVPSAPMPTASAPSSARRIFIPEF